MRGVALSALGVIGRFGYVQVSSVPNCGGNEAIIEKAKSVLILIQKIAKAILFERISLALILFKKGRKELNCSFDHPVHSFSILFHGFN